MLTKRYHLYKQEFIMKRTFLAIALLASSIASAAVKLDVVARCGEYSCTQEYVLSEADATATITSCPDKGVSATVSLKHETPEHAVVEIALLKGEEVLQSHDLELVYGTAQNVKCPHEGTDAEMNLTVSHLSVTETE